MNLLRRPCTHFMLLICMMKQIHGSHIPLEIVQLDTGTRLSEQQIRNSEYHIVHDAFDTLAGNDDEAHDDDKSIEGFRDYFHIRKLSDNEARPTKDVAQPRIFYQTGSSEEDLPVCEINEICSKIDLYRTPWIERQCRCPSVKHYRIFKGAIHDFNHIEKNHELRTRNRQAIQYNLRLELLSDSVYKIESDYLLKSGDLQDIDNHLMRHDDQLKVHSHDLKEELALHAHNFVKNRRRVISMDDLPPPIKVRHHNSANAQHAMRSSRCSNSLNKDDGYTIADKTRLYKTCEPVQRLPVCRYFQDYTWTLISYTDVNVTQQIVHCRCPPNSISYLIKREPLKGDVGGFTYLFACSPQSKLKCQRKDPCKLFTVRKRQEQVDEVNTNALCQCASGYRCPKLHTDIGVILGRNYVEDNIRTYSGYCMKEN